MKRLLLLLLICALPAYADWSDSTAQLMASSVYDMLSIDTSGTQGFPRRIMVEYARMAFDKVGSDVGKDTSRQIIVSAGAGGVQVDTALINVMSVQWDSAGYDLRFLTRMSYDSLVIKQFDHTISKDKKQTHYAVFGDSLIMMPECSVADTFTVYYYKRFNHLTDSTTVTTLSEEYRDAALFYACFLSLMKIDPKSAPVYLEVYKQLRDDLLNRRGR